MEDKQIVTPEVVQQIKLALSQVLAEHCGYGRVMIEIRNGQIRRIGISEIWLWHDDSSR